MVDRIDPKQQRVGQSTRNISSTVSAQSVARGLGWFSIALGMAELLAPRTVSRTAGLDANASVVRLYGFRELACGIGILTSAKVAPFLWARIGGDVLDIGTIIARSDSSSAADRNRTLGALVSVAGVTALDLYAARGLEHKAPRGPASALYDYSGRSGFPRGLDRARGNAADFEVPRDMRTPDALRAWTDTKTS
ncbi:hypothetical protein AWB64_05266 [Caballeronia sordidicola]|uniref:Cyclase dehydrase n=1 Tax=Caballeronia sordidicola TaxID=196367 RepID=A0A158I1P1_CABSO|nr:hypothetical protein [Caballeronia sordidicola]SAL50011.1 hypothetical protein AWB64_05266 [Caballeronia sordidicola]